MEKWKHIPGYRGLYEASTEGRVRSLYTDRVLKPWLSNSGYPTVTLYREGKARDWFVHHLVLLSFVGPRPGGMEAAHGNDVKVNNRLANLSWSTHSDNLKNRSRTSKTFTSSYFGEEHHLSKLTADDVAAIRKLYATGKYSQATLGKRFNVSQPSISAAILRQTWVRM